jgi:putative IMPACT (imprinted ancient) family translation regulator
VNEFRRIVLQDKKVSEATHNILAYRLPESQGRDDDGEGGAGDRVLHFMVAAGLCNVAVIVTRWFGGVLLGRQRFRCIIQAATDALQEAGFVSRKG